MVPDDIDAGMALVAEAGWNQTPADWIMMLRLGRGFAVRDDGGRVVASSMILPYPPRFGWIGMVLVHGPFRRRGLATRLLRHAIADLEQAGLAPMLDATPAGKALYETLGFKPLFELQRWRGTGGGIGRHGTQALGLATATAMDAAAFGADRAALLADFAGREGAFAASGDESHVFTRFGRVATQVGPALAATDAAAVAMVGETLAAIDGPVLLDVPVRETGLAALLSERGFTVERPFTRMVLSNTERPLLGAAARAIAGPELG